MRRLRASIEHQGLAEAVSVLNPTHEVALFDSVAHPMFGKPFVVRVDGVYYDGSLSENEREARNAPIRASLERAIGCIYQSEHARKMCESILSVSPSRSTVINNAVPLSLFSPEGADMRRELGFAPETRVIVGSAKWRPVKRPHAYLEVLEALRESGDDYRLLLLGETPGIEFDPELVVTAGQLAPDDLAPWYRTGDVFLNLAYGDPCDNTVVEAAASGLPCVVTWIGGSAEVVRRAHAGRVSSCEPEFRYGEYTDTRLLPAIDAETVAEDVRAVFGDLPAYRAAIRRSELDIDRAARQYVAFLEEVLA